MGRCCESKGARSPKRSASAHRVHLVGPVARCASGDMHLLRFGFNDDREDGAPESRFRIVIGVAANRSRMAVMVSERRLDGFQINGVFSSARHG